MKKSYAVRALASILVVLSLMVFTITFSIGIPIYFRPFYYAQIEPLGITEATGYDREAVIEAYNEVLDYLTLPGGEFGAGVFAFSEEGASHFADCKGLFTLNLVLFVFTGALLLTAFLLYKRQRFLPIKPFGLSPCFYSGAATLSLFALLGALVAIDFDRAFVVFHSIFFPGKDNWLFNPSEDEIILAMPEEFFMNCAIVIASSIIVISLALMLVGIALKLRRDRAKK